MAAFNSFIEVLRDIRDVKYPFITTAYEAVVSASTTITQSMASIASSTATAVSSAASASNSEEVSLLAKSSAEAANASAIAKALEAFNSASSAANASANATLKANQIQNLSAFASTLVPGSSATASYNSTTGLLTLGIPGGAKGDKGDPYSISAFGLASEKSTYDTSAKGFSFFALDTGMLYFKLSSTSGDWTAGFLFGKGDTGDTGAQGFGWLSAAGVPSALSGVNGDFYLNSLNGDVYNKVTGAWVLIMNLLPALNDAVISGASSWSSTKIDNAITALIDDASTAALKTWSSSKINTMITSIDPIDKKISRLTLGAVTYNTDGTLATMTYTGGYKTLYTYASGNLSTVQYTDIDGTTVLLTETMGYTSGNLTSVTRS